MNKTKKRMRKEIHRMAKSLHDIGAMDVVTMREFDAFCFPEIHELSPTRIKKLRHEAHMSQPIFANIINVSTATIKQWERGERKPSGAALKLLFIIQKKGIEVAL